MSQERGIVSLSGLPYFVQADDARPIVAELGWDGARLLIVSSAIPRHTLQTGEGTTCQAVRHAERDFDAPRGNALEQLLESRIEPIGPGCRPSGMAKLVALSL